jgi:predicted dehydrogenase
MNTTAPHRVGVIGANARTSWAAHSHLPAIVAAENVQQSAIATPNPRSAEESAQTFGATHAFTDAAELVACDDVDLVVVSVKSPGHADLVRSAFAAGKHVWCEWPLGPGGSTTRDLGALAKASGLAAIAGLRGRFAPPVAHAHDLIDQGYIGQPMSVHGFAQYDWWGERIAAGYAADEQANAHVVTIPGRHTFDILSYLVGHPREVSGALSYQSAGGFAVDLDRQVEMTAPTSSPRTAWSTLARCSPCRSSGRARAQRHFDSRSSAAPDNSRWRPRACRRSPR